MTDPITVTDRTTPDGTMLDRIPRAALSYAGSLTITVIVDPDLVPDLMVLTTALEREPRTLAHPG